MTKHHYTEDEKSAALVALEAFPLATYAELSRQLGMGYSTLRRLAVGSGLEGLRGLDSTDRRQRVRDLNVPASRRRAASHAESPMEQLDLGI